MCWVIAREVYPPTVLCLEDGNKNWIFLCKDQTSNITLFWDYSSVNKLLNEIKSQYPDAKVVGIHIIERLITLKQIGDRIQKDKIENKQHV